MVNSFLAYHTLKENISLISHAKNQIKYLSHLFNTLKLSQCHEIEVTIAIGGCCTKFPPNPQLILRDEPIFPLLRLDLLSLLFSLRQHHQNIVKIPLLALQQRL